MPGTDSYGQSIPLALLEDAPDAQLLASGLANGVIQRSIMRFDSATHRGAVITSPVEGMVTYLRDTNSTDFYTGGSWRPLYETMPRVGRGRVASTYSEDGPVVGNITGTNLLMNSWDNAVPVSTSRRYRVYAAFTWISPTIGMSAKIWPAYVPTAVALPGNGTGAFELAYRVGTMPNSNCNQMLSCSADFNGPLNGNINIGVYASKVTGLSGGFTVQADPIELWLEDVGAAF